MSPRRLLTTALLVFVAGTSYGAEAPIRREAPPRPKPILPPSAQAIDAAITRGVDFLVRRQGPAGWWGAARNTKELNIYAPVPGAHQAFRAAVTSLCVSALIESGDKRPVVIEAIDSGEAWLVEHLPKLRRAHPRAIYNNWGHAFGIQAMVRMIGRAPEDSPRREQLRKLIAVDNRDANLFT